MSLRDDRRGSLAFPIYDIMIVGLGTFALLYGLTFTAGQQLFTLGAGQVTGDAATGLGYARQAFRYLPFFAMTIAAFALMARAVARRRRA